MTPSDHPDRALTRARLGAQLLGPSPASSTEQVLERLLAVQAQDPRGARLAIRARSTLASVADVDEALTQRRSAVVTWLNRGTLHLVASDDYWWLHPLTTPQLRTGVQRRLRQEGLEPAAVERGVGLIAEAVSTIGPQTRAELKRVLDASGIRTEGQALVYLLFTASLEGRIVRGPMRDGESAYADVASWLGPAPAPLGQAEGLARLARRYLAGHGPAGPADLAKWAGVTLGQARSAFEAIADEVSVGSGGQHVTGMRAPARMPRPRLLGSFDPVLHGWIDRGPLVGHHQGVVTVNGIFRPTALVNGGVVGTWGLTGGQVRLHLLEVISRSSRQALERDARAVLAFLGKPQTPLVVDPAI
jgi:hypothetical protein